MSSDRPLPVELMLQGTSQRQRLNPSRLPARKTVAPSSSRTENVPKQPSIRYRPAGTNQSGTTKLVKPAPKKRDDARSMFSKRGFPPTIRQEQPIMGPTKSNIPQKTHTPIFEPARTPSLVSGSSVSTGDSPRSNMLRRKASFGRTGYRASPESSSPEGKNRHQISSLYDEIYPDTVLGISLPPTTQRSLVNKPSGDLVINLDQFVPYPILSTIDLPPPTPVYAMSATSSSRFSPGPFSLSSTPTSMTCYSPATCTSGPNSSSVQIHLGSPKNIRPTLSRNGTSQTTTSQNTSSTIPARQSSSSSGSTVRAGFGYRGKISLPSSPKPVIENGIRRLVIQNPPSRSQSPVKSTRPNTKSKQREQYPELAHLKDASPMSSLPKIIPSRPSRDGTPDIRFARASPIIQSNMSSLPMALHKRQSSSESRKSIDLKNRFGMPRKSSSREPSPGPISIPLVPTTLPRRMTPDIPSDSEKKAGKQSPNPEKSQSRFGFFKRSKTEPTISLSNKEKEKRLRKGPTAGTGHEGYGKFGARGRSGSTTSGTSIGRSSSADSSKGANTRSPSSRKGSLGSKGGPVLDEFLVERLNPITLRGTGPVVQSQERGPSCATQITNNSEVLSRQDSSVSPLAVQNTIPSAVTSKVYAKSPDANISSNSINTVGSDTKPNRFGSLSVRRSSRKSLLEPNIISAISNNSREFHFPSHPAIDPLERKLSEPTPVVSLGSEHTEPPLASAHCLETASISSAKVTKKWNFFQRARLPPKKVEQESESISVDIPHQGHLRAAGHYAMMDAPRKIDVSELEKIMLEADDSADDPTTSIESDPTSPVMDSKHGNSILLPAPPPFIPDFAFPARPESPKIVFQTDSIGQSESIAPEVMESPPKPRGSRLAQVGRIPRVVSRRERDRKPSISSFSRPFHPSQPSPALQSTGFARGALPLPPHGDDSNEPSPLVSSNRIYNTTSTQPTPDLALFGSGISSPTSLAPNDVSGLAEMISASPVLVISQHDQWAEDVWDEYDDLLDSFSPQSPKLPKTPKTPHTGSSLGAPFQYSTMSMLPDNAYSADQQIDVPSITVPSMEAMAKSVRFPSMRESESFMRGSLGSPMSPASITDFLDREGIRKSTASGRFSMPSTSRLSSSSNRFSLPASVRAVSSAHKRPHLSIGSIPETVTSSQKKRDSLSIQKLEIRTMGYENMANLRFGALMTSKWLSFGRVLFSPAHHELKGAKEDRVLVLDGLGKDWSYYVALTYHNSMVYNLSIDPPDLPTENSQGGPFGSPPNHKHIHHPDMGCPFPFPKGFFTAVVFRFPPIASESQYRFTIAECKRVLQPGGYLEISCLDMDMLNMGNLGRRAIRGLKEKLHTEDPTVSLKPVSDTLQRLVGRRGFENLSRCFVGVPAAGCIPNSGEGSISSGPTSPTKESFNNQIRSFGDMLRDASPAGEASITQMVARVARWWYSRCYETDVLSNGNDKSIWTDMALVKECETRGTSLRLMVCFAQKPECAVRRTISV